MRVSGKTTESPIIHPVRQQLMGDREFPPVQTFLHMSDCRQLSTRLPHPEKMGQLHNSKEDVK